MGIFKGFGLAGRLAVKHFGKLGDELAGTIAAFDPETATEADREQLAGTLRTTSRKLAEARASYDKEHDDVVKLEQMIASDEQIVPVLSDKLSRGETTEATVNLFLDELEENKARLATEKQEEADALAYRDQVQQIVDQLSKQLAQFDEHAKKAINQINRAKADKDLQEMKLRQQAELKGITSGISASSSALTALTKKAQNLSADAEAARIVADVGQRPADQAAEVQRLRDEAAGRGKMSAADRLKSMMPTESSKG